MTGKSSERYCGRSLSSQRETDWYASNPQGAGRDSCHFQVGKDKGKENYKIQEEKISLHLNDKQVAQGKDGRGRGMWWHSITFACSFPCCGEAILIQTHCIKQVEVCNGKTEADNLDFCKELSQSRLRVSSIEKQILLMQELSFVTEDPVMKILVT